MASVLADRRPGLCRLCSTRLVFDGLAPPLTCVAGNGGVRSSGKMPKDTRSHPGVTGEGKTGWGERE